MGGCKNSPITINMKNKKDIGNLNNKEFGCELDPTNKLKLVEDKDKGQKAYYLSLIHI